MPTYYNNGNGGAIHSSGDITHNTTHNSETTNHIYLDPHINQGEYDNWMRQIGSLLQISAQYASLKPILELIIASIEPNRIFLLDSPPIPEHGVAGCTEIILAIDMDSTPSKKVLDGFLRLCCTRMQDVILSFHSSQQVEVGLENGHPYYSTHCKEEFLVFSASPYRLPKTPEAILPNLKAEILESYEKNTAKASTFLDNAKQNKKKQTHNLVALMLHQCLEQLYMSTIHAFGGDCPKSHNLVKLKTKASKYLPQIRHYIDASTLEFLTTAHQSLTAHRFDVDEILDISTLLDEADVLLKTVRTIFNKRIERMFGETVNLSLDKPKSKEADKDEA